jgi:nicotinamide mononucleotide (NMN) deamidase PncC
MDELNKIASQISEILKSKKETISVVESSSGGLISAALLSQPGHHYIIWVGKLFIQLDQYVPLLD